MSKKKYFLLSTCQTLFRGFFFGKTAVYNEFYSLKDLFASFQNLCFLVNAFANGFPLMQLFVCLVSYTLWHFWVFSIKLNSVVVLIKLAFISLSCCRMLQLVLSTLRVSRDYRAVSGLQPPSLLWLVFQLLWLFEAVCI